MKCHFTAMRLKRGRFARQESRKGERKTAFWLKQQENLDHTLGHVIDDGCGLAPRT
ncbi:hypothetical protein EMIT091MI3_100157 [Kosakonia quasisacchari]